ncbi:MAG: Smr/MutS family protein [Hyphomicrobiaceae bacterium]
MAGGGDRRRPRGLSEEDAALWRHVTRDVRRTVSKTRVAPVDMRNDATSGGDAAARPQRTRTPDPVEARPAPPAKPSRPEGKRAAREVQDEPQMVVLERRKARRIARGGIEIEARLDLHGMTQDEAHGALSQFLHRAAADGLKTVLIITGKGAPQGRSTRDGDNFGRDRGVLRRNVPRWLGSPQLRGLVISYAAAHARHGGEGALYVTLRRRGG